MATNNVSACVYSTGVCVCVVCLRCSECPECSPGIKIFLYLMKCDPNAAAFFTHTLIYIYRDCCFNTFLFLVRRRQTRYGNIV